MPCMNLDILFIQVNDRHQNGTNRYTYEKTLRKFYHGQTDECDSITHRLPSKLMHQCLCVFGARLYNFHKKLHSLVSENMFGQKEISRLLTAGHGDSMCHHFPCIYSESSTTHMQACSISITSSWLNLLAKSSAVQSFEDWSLTFAPKVRRCSTIAVKPRAAAIIRGDRLVSECWQSTI